MTVRCIGQAKVGKAHGWHHTGSCETVCPLQLPPALKSASPVLQNPFHTPRRTKPTI